MKNVMLAFLSQNVRRFFWLFVLVAIIACLAFAGEKAKAVEWLLVLAGVALTQVRSNSANPELTPKKPEEKDETK